MVEEVRAGSRPTPWRDNLEAVSMAVIMALVLKYFIVEAYKIPTGSMQPTLMGNDATGVYDRILVDKLSYLFRDPERFEVVVFRFPLDRSKSFVKRVVGMPGEEIKIEYGDVYVRPFGEVAYEPLRRPRAVQASTWKRLVASDTAEEVWRIHADEGWSSTGLDVVARGTGSLRLVGDGVVDQYNHGYPDALRDRIQSPPRGLIRHPVGDLRVEGELFAWAGCESIEIVLREGSRSYRFHLPGPAAPEDARPWIRSSDDGAFPSPGAHGEALGEPWRLPSDRPLAFGAQNLDDLLEFDVEGEVLLSLEVPPATNQHGSGIELRQVGEGAQFSGLTPLRDIYYVAEAGGNLPHRIEEGEYYMLGDNTQDSSDSRVWTLARYPVPDPAGSEASIVVRGQARGGENPTRAVYPEGVPGGLKLFVDEYGERHELPAGTPSIPPHMPSATVPREMILGRAVAVFWPISVRERFARWKWVL